MFGLTPLSKFVLFFTSIDAPIYLSFSFCPPFLFRVQIIKKWQPGILIAQTSCWLLFDMKTSIISKYDLASIIDSSCLVLLLYLNFVLFFTSIDAPIYLSFSFWKLNIYEKETFIHNQFEASIFFRNLSQNIKSEVYSDHSYHHPFNPNTKRQMWDSNPRSWSEWF